MTVLEQISHETMVFMRGRYRLDEIGDEIGRATCRERV